SFTFTPARQRSFFFLSFVPPPTSTLFPYTTLFRSAKPVETLRSEGRHHGSGKILLVEDETALRELAGRMLTEAGYIVASTGDGGDRKSTRLNSSHGSISYAVFCLKKKR